MFLRPSARIPAALASSALLIGCVAVAAGPQEPPATAAQGAEKEKDGRKTETSEVIRDAPIEDVDRPRDDVTKQIEKWLDSYDLKPRPSPSIPDDPPPHEGAMIDLALVVEPPDLVLVEVLEALPGRPISGERLVRPDGSINLGFYGVVHVSGLSLPQIKIAIIKHLRRYLDDEALGLRAVPIVDEQEAIPVIPQPPKPGAAANPFDVDPAGKEGKPAPSPVVRPGATGARFVDPVNSTRVFVDITSYNSKNYYVTGDVSVPGRLPCTGRETVLDALQFAGGLMPTAEPRDIRLVRPGRNGKPSRVYRVDLEAIRDRGDVRSNYQIFPGDRLIIGRDEVVKRTIEIDRLHAAIQPIVGSIQQNVNMVKSLGPLSAEQGDRLRKDLVDFWAKQVARQGDLKFDEQTVRDLLLKQLKPATASPGATPAPGSR